MLSSDWLSGGWSQHGSEAARTGHQNYQSSGKLLSRGSAQLTCHVQVAGFNAARVSVVKGLVQAGIEVVCIADVTTVNWDWPQRAKKKPRKN